VTPASTFKIPHALAALDSGVLSGAEAMIRYDHSPAPFDAWRRDQTLTTAIRYSAVWYFQRVAEMLGAEREHSYLAKFDYGNRDASSGLTTFWLGESLLISPVEQEQFLLRLYRDELPVNPDAMQTVRAILVQPRELVINAAGEHPFAPTWADDTVVSAKTGSQGDDERAVRWLVGHVRRGARSWIFVACVMGNQEPLAAVNLAAESLRSAHVLE
jgi:beta-lactamase class D